MTRYADDRIEQALSDYLPRLQKAWLWVKEHKMKSSRFLRGETVAAVPWEVPAAPMDTEQRAPSQVLQELKVVKCLRVSRDVGVLPSWPVFLLAEKGENLEGETVLLSGRFLF